MITEAFLFHLRARGRRRIPLVEIRAAFLDTAPEHAQAADQRRRIRDLLDALAGTESIELPRGKSSWDYHGEPALPKWILVEQADGRTSAAAIDAWLPFLSFASEISDPRTLEPLRQINRWMIRHRHTLMKAPIRERSIQIFGDEKRLDSLRTGDTLFGGKLPLAHLGIIDVPVPMAHESPDRGAPGQPLLISENHNSYWSLTHWNGRFRQFAAVAWGSGQAFSAAAKALDEIAEKTHAAGIQYVGDIDPAGLRIVMDVSDRRVRAGLSPVQPCIEFYEWLVAHGTRGPLKSEITARQMELPGRWLPADLAEAVCELWQEGQRIPQEGLGLEALYSDFSPSI